MRTPALILVLAASAFATGAATQPDPLAAEITRWMSVLASDSRTDPLWLDARKNAEPALAQAEAELKQGRRLVALERLQAAAQSLGAAVYATGRPAAERRDLAAFEAEWKRVGMQLRDVTDPNGSAAAAAAAMQPALVRALAELSLAQARESYAASLEYGRNTEPQYGLYYLGAAQAQRAFLDFARRLPVPSGLRPPSLRTMRSDIDALQAELLSAYRPPASIDRHPEFIVASSALKEARELDAAGRRHAALMRYLQAAQRIAMIRHTAADLAAVRQRLETSAARLSGGVDHSIGRLFVERARSALAGSPGGGDAAAAALATDVLPRYLAALEPAPPPAAAAEPRVTVTLVRWPFT